MADVARDRARLIDHFKRLYTIIAGLAITEASRRILPLNFDPSAIASIWMFAAFFITVVPIFQGGDRSLDLKYLDEPPGGGKHSRAAFLWDVYMLFITALIFVGVAESIPCNNAATCGDHGSTRFMCWLAALFVFDVFVLVIDKEKSHVPGKLATYDFWIVINAAMFALCLLCAAVQDANPNIPAAYTPFILFVAACARTVFDYSRSGDFMFP